MYFAICAPLAYCYVKLVYLPIWLILRKLNSTLQVSTVDWLCFFGSCSHWFILLISQVRGIKPLPLPEMANLFNSYCLTVCPGLVSPNLLFFFFTFGYFLLILTPIYPFIILFLLSICFRTPIQTILWQVQHSIQKVREQCSVWSVYILKHILLQFLLRV